MCAHVEAPDAGLLAPALRDPLPVPVMGSAMYHWLHELRRCLPLWSFQPYAYYNLQDTELATTFPLQVIIDSIVEDDELPKDPPAPIDPPVATVDRRRAWLADSALAPSTLDAHTEWSYEDREPVALRSSASPRLLQAPELFDPGSESEYHFDPPSHEAEEVGRRISRLVERREEARAQGDREGLQEARLELERYLREIGVDTGAGRPREGPAPAVLRQLYREGEALFQSCWEVCPFTPSDRTLELLGDLDLRGIEPCLWAVNFVLPVLSMTEVRVLANEIQASRAGARGSQNPTPRRTAVAVLARRLGMEPPSVARRIWGSGGAIREFKSLRNPFDDVDGA